MSSSGMFSVCKNSVYASSHALPIVHSLGEKACAASVTDGSTAHTWDQQDQENSTVEQ